MKKGFKRIYRFWKDVVVGFYKDNCLVRAAALAYTALLSIVPLATVSFVVIKAFPVFQGFTDQVENYIFSNFIATSAKTIQQYIHQFSEQAMQLSSTGLIFLLVTAVLMIFNMEASFNAIWRARSHRRGIPAFLMYWAVITLLPVLIGMGFAISSFFVSLPLVVYITKTLGVNSWLLILTPYFLTFVAFTLLYLTIPNTKVLLRHAAAGGAVAAILFELSKWLFTLYLAHFKTYQLLYGALATIPLFLIWMYLSWLVVLFGAEVSYVLSRD